MSRRPAGPRGPSFSGIIRHLLVVDDDIDFADSLCGFLALNGYQVATAYNADQARHAIERMDVPVAIIDLGLGSSSGLDLIEDFKRRRPGLRCLVSTAHADDRKADEALERGAFAYLVKPLDLDRLLATLERCFQSPES